MQIVTCIHHNILLFTPKKSQILKIFSCLIIMELLKETIYSSFFTQPLMLLSAFVACVLGFVHRKKFPELKFMALYPMASLFQGLFTYYSWISENSTLSRADIISESLFIFFEFIIIFSFFDKVIILKKFKLYIRIIFVLHIVFILLMWTFTEAFHKHVYKTYLADSLCILSFCFLYFFQLFKLPPESNLLNSPSFWVTLGCLFYFSCTIPLFFADSILIALPHYYTLYSINFLAYTVLFLSISKAFLCNPVLRK